MIPGFPFKIIDLTHALEAVMPLWPGDPELHLQPVSALATEGYTLNRLSMGEHSGTHVGAPCHFYENSLSMADFPQERLVMPLAKISFPAGCDALLTAQSVLEWEELHGDLSAEWAVIVETGWSRFWPDAKAYFAEGGDGRMHFPGISEAAMRYLVEHRGVSIAGIDSAGLDGGLSVNFSANKLLAKHGGFHLENLASLDRVPAFGAWLVIGALPIAGGSGSPARVLALAPQ